MDTKSKIRAATVGKKKYFRSKIVEVEGVSIEIREPNKIIKQQIVEKSQEPTKKGSNDIPINFLDWKIWHIVECSFVPGTEDKIFDETDIPNLTGGPVGDFAGKLWDELEDIISAEEDVKEAKKS
jgi:hypothetical protein